MQEFPQFTFSSSVRDLGVTLDQELTFTRHISLHFFVVSSLDYCSALYVGFPAARVGCLVRVLCSAARYIGCIPRFRHVTDYMRDVLHWLPFPQWIAYRISSLVWR